MISKKVTKIVILVPVLGLIVFDLLVAADMVPGNTLSEVTRDWGSRLLFIPNAGGVLAAHLFMYGKRLSPWSGAKAVLLVAGPSLLYVLWDLYQWTAFMPLDSLVDLAAPARKLFEVPFGIGLVWGRLFWAQPPKVV